MEWGRKLVNATLLSVFKVRRLLANFTQLSEMKKKKCLKTFCQEIRLRKKFSDIIRPVFSQFSTVKTLLVFSKPTFPLSLELRYSSPILENI